MLEAARAIEQGCKGGLVSPRKIAREEFKYGMAASSAR
jgi:hypothetical protein